MISPARRGPDPPLVGHDAERRSPTRARTPTPSTYKATAGARGQPTATTRSTRSRATCSRSALARRSHHARRHSLGGIAASPRSESIRTKPVAPRTRARRRRAPDGGSGTRPDRRLHVRPHERRLRVTRRSRRRDPALQPAPAPALGPPRGVEELAPHADGRLFWHWDPAFLGDRLRRRRRNARRRSSIRSPKQAARAPVPDAVGSRSSQRLAQRGGRARNSCELVPHAQWSTSAARATWSRAIATTSSTTQSSRSSRRPTRPLNVSSARGDTPKSSEGAVADSRNAATHPPRGNIPWE